MDPFNRPRPEYDRIFYTGMSVLFVIIVLIGFGPTYYFRGLYNDEPLPIVVHIHGVVFSVWILLFLLQATLISRKRVKLHKNIGGYGATLTAIMFMLGMLVPVLAIQRRHFDTIEDANAFFVLSMVPIMVFLILAMAGISNQKRPEVHKRLMILASIDILVAAVARFPLPILSRGPIAFFILTDALLLLPLAYDLLSRKRINAAYLWGGSLIIISQLVQFWLMDADFMIEFTKTLLLRS